MAPKYRLTYFPVKGLGEPIRLLLSYGNIEFENRIVEDDDWEEFKKSTPFAQVPMLEIDDKVYHQSIAISRYLGKKFGLDGNNDEENLEIDIAVAVFEEFLQRIADAHYEEDEAIKERKTKTLTESIIPMYANNLNKMATDNKGYLAIGKLTWADIFFAGIIDYINSASPQDILTKYPNLKAVRDNVLALPAIKAWYNKTL